MHSEHNWEGPGSHRTATVTQNLTHKQNKWSKSQNVLKHKSTNRITTAKTKTNSSCPQNVKSKRKPGGIATWAHDAGKTHTDGFEIKAKLNSTCFVMEWTGTAWDPNTWYQVQSGPPGKELSWAELSWVELSWVEMMSWVELSWVELSWVQFSWIELL